MNFEIRKIEKEEISNILPLLQILNPGMDHELISQRIDIMLQHQYECIGIYDGDRLIGISGYWILHKVYAGKHIEPDNVIIHPDYRNKKLGEKLLEWIHDLARKENCNTSEINCFSINHAGYKFWINQGYEIIGFHMIKKL